MGRRVGAADQAELVDAGRLGRVREEPGRRRGVDQGGRLAVGHGSGADWVRVVDGGDGGVVAFDGGLHLSFVLWARGCVGLFVVVLRRFGWVCFLFSAIKSKAFH